MKKKFIFFLFIFLNIAMNGAAQTEVSDADILLQEAQKYDKQYIEIQGEIIGDKFTQGQHCWINFSAGKSVIGLWLNKNLADTIKYFGDYKHIGDRVKAEGIFNYRCPEHGGELDIHVVKFVIIKPGYGHGINIAQYKLYLAATLFIIALFSALLYRLRISYGK